MIADFLAQIDEQIQMWLLQVTTAFLGWLGSGALRGLLIIAIIGFGWGFFTGRIKTPGAEAARKVLILVVAFSLIFAPALLFSYVYPLFREVPYELAALLPAAPATDTSPQGPQGALAVYAALDRILMNGFQSGATIMEQGDGWFLPYVAGAAVWIGTVLVVGYATFLVLLSKLALALLLGFTPFFLMMLLFETTKGLFERWLGMLMNYSLIPMFTLSLCSFTTVWIDRKLDQMAANGSEIAASDIAGFFIASAVAFLVLLQVMQMAAGIGGGIALSTVGGASAAWGFAADKGRAAVGSVSSRMQARRDAKERAAADRRSRSESNQTNSKDQQRGGGKS